MTNSKDWPCAVQATKLAYWASLMSVSAKRLQAKGHKSLAERLRREVSNIDDVVRCARPEPTEEIVEYGYGTITVSQG